MGFVDHPRPSGCAVDPTYSLPPSSLGRQEWWWEQCWTCSQTDLQSHPSPSADLLCDLGRVISLP